MLADPDADPGLLAGPREHAVRQVVDVEQGARGAVDPGAHRGRPAARGRARSSSGSMTLQEPNDVNQRRAPAIASSPWSRQRSSTTSATRSSSDRDHVVGPAPSNASRVASSTLRKPWCSNPSAPVCRSGVVQPGRALERRLPVQRGVDPRGQGGRGGEQVRTPARRCGTSAAARPPPRRRRRPASSRRAPAGGARRRRASPPRGRPSSRAASTAATTRRALPARSSRSRSAISRPATSASAAAGEVQRAGRSRRRRR